MNDTEMITTTGYTALRDFNLADAMRDELGGMDITFDRVTIPSAGGTTFELPGELPGETDAVKEFTGVILYHHPLHAFYRERFTGGNNAPDCGSYDGMTGVGNPGGDCASCPLNQFGSGGKRRQSLQEQAPYLYLARMRADPAAANAAHRLHEGIRGVHQAATCQGEKIPECCNAVLAQEGQQRRRHCLLAGAVRRFADARG